MTSPSGRRFGPVATLAVLTVLLVGSAGAAVTPETVLGDDAPADGPTDRAAGDGAAPEEYRFRFKCPEEETTTGGVGYNITTEGCPYPLYDAQDIMGNPVLAVDPRNPDHMAVASLHGSAGDGPTKRSRGAMPHTTYATTDMFVNQHDNPYYPPGDLQSESEEIYGEHVAATTDDRGGYYLAPVYSYQRPNETAWSWTIALWQFRSIVELDEGSYSNRDIDYITTDTANARIQRPGMVHSPTTDLVAMTWLEIPNGSASGHVRVAFTTDVPDSPWQILELEEEISPCTSITNPQVWQGHVFLGCANSPGPIRTYAINVTSGAITSIARAPFGGDHPVLGMGPEGYSVLAASSLVSESEVEVELAWGRWADGWIIPEEYGRTFQTQAEETIIEARLQEVVYRPDTGAAHFVYMERYEREDATTNPLRPVNGEPGYRKAFVSIHSDAGVLYQRDLNLSFPEDEEMDYASYQVDPEEDVFSDLRDSLVLVGDGTGANGSYREFIAYGDYGIVDFAEVVERVPGATPLPANAFPQTPAFAAPSAAGAQAGALQISGSQLMFGAALGTLSFAMMARLMGVQTESSTEAKAGARE